MWRSAKGRGTIFSTDPTAAVLRVSAPPSFKVKVSDPISHHAATFTHVTRSIGCTIKTTYQGCQMADIFEPKIPIWVNF
jgi:hypothetical protein